MLQYLGKGEPLFDLLYLHVDKFILNLLCNYRRQK